ncbi:MAG: hypothetical protein GXX96_01815 [Planctomycetaceae bacterium]|jgi:hypothetical protein|nr:hypothetical protein [Planctomycetaceae bacterium]
MPVHRSFSFVSPLTRLVVFFKDSRDKWKEKCKAAKRQKKSLSVLEQDVGKLRSVEGPRHGLGARDG